MPDDDHATKNGRKALLRVRQTLVKIGWEPETTDIEGLLRIDFEKDAMPILDAHADVRVDYERFLFYLNFRDRASPRLRKQAMEFVTRANLGLVVGNFELDIDDGSVRFKASIDFTGVELGERLIRNLIRSSMDVVEQYADTLVQVLRGEKGAAEAIREAESG